jgi:hypothetical protein
MITYELYNTSSLGNIKLVYMIHVEKNSDDIYIYMMYIFFILCSIQLAILQRLRNIENAQVTFTRIEDTEYEQELPAEDPIHHD